MGKMDKDESKNCQLLVIYMLYHLKRKTVLLIHENVPGFVSALIQDTAMDFGYGHVQVRCKPMDVGVHIGRPRKQLSIVHKFFFQVFP